MLSPGVETKETDKTLSTSSQTTHAMAMIGCFRWGPVEDIVRITVGKEQLVQRMGRPDSSTQISFLSAENYIKYVTPLYLVRAVDTETALNAVVTGQDAILVKNDSDYEDAVTDNIPFMARYPGSMGNSLRVELSTSNGYDEWEYSTQFQYDPEGNEFNMVVIDEDGVVSGTSGTVLETYELMRTTEGALRPDGTSAYIKKVLENQSNYILAGDLEAIGMNADDFSGSYAASMEGGVDGNNMANADFTTAINRVNNSENVEIIGGFAPGASDDAKGTLIDTMESRGDAIGVVGPPLSAVYNATDPVSSLKEYFTQTINRNSSYGVYCDNWKLVTNTFSDTKVWIPCSSDVAALMARVFVQNEPWYSPAGLNRGQIKNTTKLAWSANKDQRDILYKNNVNSIVSFEGEGRVLWGDKTALRRPSAFSRINVRMLFIVLKKSIARSARYQLFEFNDEITRTTFRNATTRYLEQVEGRRGIQESRVVCDTSNNTEQVRSNNEFVGDIYVLPNFSINFITLNFIAVNGTAQFEESEG